MKVFLIEVDLRQLLQFVKPKEDKSAEKHAPRSEAITLQERWRQYWLRNAEPADAWLID